MSIFQQLVSPEEKEISALVTTSGGVKALGNDDKMLLSLEETASRASSVPGAEGHRALRTEASDADNLKLDIFEDPTDAIERNQVVFFLKFEAQKVQIIDELSLAVQRESDRVILVNGEPHEQIRDRVSRPAIHYMYAPFLTLSSVNSRDLESHGRYHVFLHIRKGINLIVSEGLALECQGSTFRTRSPGLLFRAIITNSRSERLDNDRLSKSGYMGNQIHRYRPTATYFRGDR